MSFFLLIVLGMPILDLAWWWWADLRLRSLRRAKRWRLLLAAFVGGNLAIYGWVLLSRMGRLPAVAPSALLATCYIWHLAVLPATTLAVVGGELVHAMVGGIARLSRSVRTRRAPSLASPAANDCSATERAAAAPVLTRRQVLAAAVVAAPPLATAIGQVRALSQLDSFRIRRLDVRLPALPVALDGLTIAHVSDLHVGRFTNGPILREVVERTNALHPELVVFTGDLIDHALGDLPAGLDVLRRLAPRERLLLCEGNHDLFAGREEFEQQVRAAGMPLLLNESATLDLRGQRVQILGLRWGQPGTAGAAIADQMERVLRLRQPETFTILLAHHPHAFDHAAAAGIPLTLSGHTHGGQLMLTESFGAGSVLFKYWSGLYRQGPSALAVSNGVGNWFPLRINAPAEVLHLTLRTARPA